MDLLIPIIVLMVVGIILMVVEIFMPGFGIPGIAGTVMLLAGIVLTWIAYSPKAGLGVTVIVLALIGVSISLSLRSAASGKLSKSELILNDPQKADEVQLNADMLALVGKEGEVRTVLRPVGVAEFDCGRLNVMTDGEYIEKGARVRIIRVESAHIFVEKA